MATKLLHLLLPVLSLLLLATTVSARPGRPFHPCNTLIISTYTFSLHQNPQNPNPNPNPNFFYHDLRPMTFRHPRVFLFRAPRHTEFRPNIELHHTEMTDLHLNSFRDRTKDILSVVASLLFGAACGALTAGTMYLIWSILAHRYGYYRTLDGFTSDDDDDDDNDDLYNPKKTHQCYVAIPASPVKEQVKDAPTTAVAAVVVAKETA